MAASSAESASTSAARVARKLRSSSSFFCRGARTLAAFSTSFLALSSALPSSALPSLSTVGSPSSPKPPYLSARATGIGGSCASPRNFSRSLVLAFSRFSFFLRAASCCCCRRSCSSCRSTAGSSGFQIAFAPARSSSLIPRSTSVSSLKLSQAAMSFPLSAPARTISRTSSRKLERASTNGAEVSVPEVLPSVGRPTVSAAPSTMPKTERIRVT
mmetsp:Transcript_12885/g.36225  ORF Transcript_12885/g.36225 Transcript_12885/m.36225 type:complete len:215 (+) Transcript_12885:208-852(+)